MEEFAHPLLWFLWEAGKGFWLVVFLYFPMWLTKAGRWSSLMFGDR